MSKLSILFLICFSVVGQAQEAVLRQSISYARAMKFNGPINVSTSRGKTSFEMQKLSRAEIEKVEQDIVGLGFVKVTEPSRSADGSIFALVQKGEGSQLMLRVLVFKGADVTKLVVEKVTPTTIFYAGGGKIDIPNSQK